MLAAKVKIAHTCNDGTYQRGRVFRTLSGGLSLNERSIFSKPKTQEQTLIASARLTRGSTRLCTKPVSAPGKIWETATIFFRRFHVTGWRRGLFELAGEGMTLGTLGVTALLTLAQPSFEETKGDWRKQDAFAVTFLDRYGNEIGQRGIIHKDAVPIDELPDHVIKAVLATEDRRFFDHVGLDFLGLARAMSENVKANSVVQGGSTITQQLAKNLFLTNERTLQRKVKEAFLSIWLEANLSKERNPAAISRPRLYGRRHVRHCRRVQLLLRQERQGCDAGRGRHARGPVQGAGQVCAAHQSSRRPRPRQRSADQHGAGRADERRPSAGSAPAPGRHC